MYRIEVSEYGNYAKRWSNTWYSDLGNVRVDLPCSGANLGKIHTIKVTWRSSTGVEQSGTWQRTFTTSGQTETFYGPY